MSIFYTPASFILIIMLGFTLKHFKIVKKDDYVVLTKILINVTLPATIIVAFSRITYSNDFFVIVLIGLIASCFPLLIYFLISGKSDTQSRLFSMINVSGFNVGCFALPFINSLMGEHAGAYAALFDTGNALIMTGGAFAIATALLQTESNQAGVFKGIISQLSKSHLFLLYIALTLLVAIDIHFPVALLKLVEPIAQANSFIAMLIIGLMFKPDIGSRKLCVTFKIITFRLVNSTIFAVIIYYYLPVSEPIRNVLVIIIFAPISSLAPLFTLKSGGDVELSSFINNISIVVGLITMSVISIFIL